MADTFLYYKAIIYKDGVHRPLATDERLTNDSIPVSQLPGNNIRLVQDGLYVGSATQATAYYVSSVSGVNATDAGTKVKPFQTIQYALDTILASYDLGDTTPDLNTVNGSITLALKAGETFPFTKTYNVRGRVELTFWDDPQYGDFNGLLIGSPGVEPAYMADLQRPVITPAVEASTNNGIYHLQLLDSLTGSPSTVALYGVRVDLPAFSSAADSDYCSFVNVAYSNAGRMQILGSIVNRTDTQSSYGAFGIHSRSEGILEEYCSQFLIQGNQIQPVGGGFQPTADQLLARKYFITFYPDLKGNNQSGGTLLNAPAPTGLLRLMWSVETADPVLPGKTNLATYPVLSDVTYGLGNYFFNLTRDNQGRPLNVTTAQLF